MDLVKIQKETVEIISSKSAENHAQNPMLEHAKII